MKRYTFEVTIEEGSDEFWESIENEPGIDQVTDVVRESLDFTDAKIELKKFVWEK